MPTCPGCEKELSYERLDIHQRYCGGIWSKAEMERSPERIERRLVNLETRLDERLRTLEADRDRRA